MVAEVHALPHPKHRGIDRFSTALISAPESFDSLITSFRGASADHADSADPSDSANPAQYFLTLDDPDQCMYTAGHARNQHDFDDVEYPANDTPEAVAEFELAQFRSCAVALRKPGPTSSWDEALGYLETTSDDVEALLEMNRRPDCVLDAVHVVQRVPSSDAADLLANLPNGYFEGDWTPYMSFAIAQRLQKLHNYTLFGIGARTLGFFAPGHGTRSRNQGETIHGADRTSHGVADLITDLQGLYSHSDSDSWTELAQVLSRSPVLLLGYTEDFAELVANETAEM